jgi:hypothetical protein
MMQPVFWQILTAVLAEQAGAEMVKAFLTSAEYRQRFGLS